VGYNLWAANAGDGLGGHGTHTAGSLAGDAQGEAAAVAHLSRANGIAYKAKLMIFDMLVSVPAHCCASD
jgi:hypothetical protein